MKCALCGFEFSEHEAASACGGCPLKKGCELVRCPNCGYEVVAEPRWLKKLRERRNKRSALRRTS